MSSRRSPRLITWRMVPGHSTRGLRGMVCSSHSSPPPKKSTPTRTIRLIWALFGGDPCRAEARIQDGLEKGGSQSVLKSGSAPKEHPRAKKNQCSQHSQCSICPPAPSCAKTLAYECDPTRRTQHSGPDGSRLSACLEIPQSRRVRARSLQQLAKIDASCRPGALTGRISKHALTASVTPRAPPCRLSV